MTLHASIAIRVGSSHKVYVNHLWIIAVWTYMQVLHLGLGFHSKAHPVATPLWGKCEVATHTPENGTWESSETLKNSERNYKGQNTSHWGVFHIVRKVLKCRCQKWPCMNHLDICSTSYGGKKGRKSNWQFDSRPLKVGNQPDSGVCRWSVTHRWKALEED